MNKCDAHKGFSNLMLTIFLIIIFIGVVMASITYLGEESYNERELPIKKDIFFVRNSLEVARVYYLSEALKHSVIQGIYNNSLRGGWDSMQKNSTIAFGGAAYSLWGSNYKDAVPTEANMLDSLQRSVFNYMDSYTRKGSIKSILEVKISGYSRSGLKVANVNDLQVKADAKALNTISASMRSGDSDILLRRNADLSETFDVPFIFLHKIGRGYYNDIRGKIAACNPAEIERSEDKYLFRSDIRVVEPISNGKQCLVRVQVNTTKDYLVFDGKNITLSPISLVFFERLGAEFRDCDSCTKGGGTWCASTKKCEKQKEDGEPPCKGEPAITSACDAVEFLTCRDCVSESTGGEKLRWCKSESRCAQQCPGQAVDAIDGCGIFSGGDRITDHGHGDVFFTYQSGTEKWLSSANRNLYPTAEILDYINEVNGYGFTFQTVDGIRTRYDDTISYASALMGREVVDMKSFISQRIAYCDRTALEQRLDRDFFVVSSGVTESTTASCTVRIVASLKKGLRVWNYDTSSWEMKDINIVDVISSPRQP